MVEPPKKTATERIIEAAARAGVRTVARPARSGSGEVIIRLGVDATSHKEPQDKLVRESDDES